MRRPSLTSIGLRVLRFQSARRLAQAGPRRITTIGAGGVAGPVDLVAVVRRSRTRRTKLIEIAKHWKGKARMRNPGLSDFSDCQSRGLLRGGNHADRAAYCAD